MIHSRIRRINQPRSTSLKIRPTNRYLRHCKLTIKHQSGQLRMQRRIPTQRHIRGLTTRHNRTSNLTARIHKMHNMKIPPDLLNQMRHSVHTTRRFLSIRTVNKTANSSNTHNSSSTTLTKLSASQFTRNNGSITNRIRSLNNQFASLIQYRSRRLVNSRTNRHINKSDGSARTHNGLSRGIITNLITRAIISPTRTISIRRRSASHFARSLQTNRLINRTLRHNEPVHRTNRKIHLHSLRHARFTLTLSHSVRRHHSRRTRIDILRQQDPYSTRPTPSYRPTNNRRPGFNLMTLPLAKSSINRRNLVSKIIIKISRITRHTPRRTANTRARSTHSHQILTGRSAHDIRSRRQNTHHSRSHVRLPLLNLSLTNHPGHLNRIIRNHRSQHAKANLAPKCNRH